MTLPGTSYPEAAETRRRLRYAILAALHVAKFEPADEKHLGYLLVTGAPSDSQTEKGAPRPGILLSAFLRVAEGMVDGVVKPGDNVTTNDDVAKPRLVIPFEAFVPSNTFQRRKIAVLWLDEDVLSARGEPLANLAMLLCEFDLGKRKFALIGPQDSTTLTAMAREIETARSGWQKQVLQRPCAGKYLPVSARLPLYNFGATADGEAVLRLAGVRKTDLERTTIEEHFKDGYIEYFQTISSDGALSETIVQELTRRGVDTTLSVPQPHSHDDALEIRRDHVALISEWDTVYGEDLQQSMERAFDRGFVQFDDGPRSPRRAVEHYSYLRGLDGRLPSRQIKKDPKSSGDEAPPTAPGSAVADHTGELESAEGQSQFDYLRRLAERIRQRDDELRLGGAGRIAAIGVLGSDVYDKLLILQALRPDFPDALFFTTDLDALLLPQKKSRYTRNLLVASSYDLKLNEGLQADIPPFRNSYQTSVFLTTRVALRNAWSHRPHKKAADKTRATLQCWLSQPLLFQIGRSAPKPLSSGPQREPSDSIENQCANRHVDHAGILDYPSVHPLVAELLPTPGSGALVSAGFLLSALLLSGLFSSSKLRRFCFPKSAANAEATPYVHPRIVTLVLLLLAVLIISVGLSLTWPNIGRLLTQGGFGDPMALLEGISVWPTIALRAVGCLLSVWMICYTLMGLEANKRVTEERMGVYDKRPPLRIQIEEIGAPQRSRIGGAAAIMFALLWFPPENVKDSALRDDGQRPQVWFRELSGGYSSSWQARCARAAAGTIAMMLVWWLILVPIFGAPNVPARGSLARAIYQSVTMSEVIATLFLIFIVADAAIYSSVFIKRLTAVSTIWPEKTLSRYENRFNVRSDGLGDWIDMQFLAQRTEYITWLIYFPFLSLALLIASRSQLFANYSMPSTLLIAQAISLAVIGGSVLALRSAAETARDAAREHLTAKIIAAKGADEKAAGQLELLLGQVSDRKKGAFAPLSSQPFVKALLLPLLSYGTTALVHFYALPGF